ncbi:MAG TPA: SpoIID/LytB domain-containing protein, partial [Blastocatellia bacterium]|nr:SpoIID/LytB domain-containing protein [Blastocatellia bacterium]
MPGLLVTIALLSFTQGPFAAQSRVRISLFSLFKPQAIEVHLARGAAALVDAGRLDGSRELGPGERARVRLAGDGLTITLLDPFGRVRHSVASKQARIIPQGEAEFDLVLPGKMRRQVRGELLIRPQEAGPRARLQITLATDVESAVARVVAAEMYGKREAEALKALAVVARTFMLSHAGRHREEGFDFCDTTHCQLYRGEADLASDLADAAVSRAVAETAGEVLAYGGDTIEAYF